MVCNGCGAEVRDDERYCKRCGTERPRTGDGHNFAAVRKEPARTTARRKEWAWSSFTQAQLRLGGGFFQPIVSAESVRGRKRGV
ncbi:MAG: hypothetical protein LBP79_04075 [Clostridiales bacterium]|nr:hypothetical protein [Clostridiales bacterium]